MSVYIKGMEMPRTGLYLISVDNTDGKDKTVITAMKANDKSGMNIIGSYELIPVPYHRRLIDADALASMYDPNEDFGKSVRDMIEDCPTIIPAEKESGE